MTPVFACAIALSMMVTLGALSPDTEIAAFRAALPQGSGDTRTADRLCELGTATQLAKGAALLPDPGEDRLVWLASGSAKLIAARAAGAPGGQVLAFHFAGDLVSLVRRSRGDFHLVALETTGLVIFPAGRFLDAAQNDPAVLRSVVDCSLEALHRSRRGMMHMGHKSAAARIAGFLVSISERLGGCTKGPCAFALPMSRRDIGDSLGLTIETVSRQFTELRAAGLVATEGRSKIVVRDLDALARFAERQRGRDRKTGFALTAQCNNAVD